MIIVDNIKHAELKEKILQENDKIARNQTTELKSLQRDKYLDCPTSKILGTILKEEVKKRTSKQGNWWLCIRAYVPEMTNKDCVCQEKKEEEDSPAFKIVMIHLYKD